MAFDSGASIPFDPDSGTLPEPLSLTGESGGGVVLLMAEPSVRESGWGPRAAVALARTWSDQGVSVLLMDGDPSEPGLHEILGRENGEGVTDAVLYGVSPDRMAAPVEDGFLFAPAGTVVAEPSSVLRHPRWSSVLTACRAAASTVVLYLPAGVPGVESLAAHADHTLRLSDTGSAREGEEDSGVRVLYPSVGTGGPPPEAPTAWKQLASKPAAGAAAAGRAGKPGSGEAGSGDSAGGPARKGPAKTGPATRKKKAGGLRPRPVKRRASVWILLLVLLLVGGILAAMWLGYIEVPGITRSPSAASLFVPFSGGLLSFAPLSGSP